MIDARHGLCSVQMRDLGIERLNDMILPLYGIQGQRISNGGTDDVWIVVLKIEMSIFDRS